MREKLRQTRGAAAVSTYRRTCRRVVRARSRASVWARRRLAGDTAPFIYADPFFVDPFCQLSPRSRSYLSVVEAVKAGK